MFKVGYKLNIKTAEGEYIPVDNNLYLSVPMEENLTAVASLSGEKTIKIEHEKDGGNIVIDLSQIEDEVSYIILTERKVLLELWQILLIVGLSVVVVASGVVVFIVIRKKKANSYGRYDKI